ncbi:MAG: hypothetical protein BGO67_07190 [Alphaproteobacteria bacterium 41-28]|nr:MAG: hypothetical protein BGO67_07190 [Alphaproteobacteria bacterium 41-28]
MTTIKMRWKDWENTCIRKAFEQKIQLKVIAAALGRTVDSVSKKIKKLELREETSKRGRLKGDKDSRARVERIPQDLAKMGKILKTYSPIKVSLKGLFILKNGYWILGNSLPQGLEKGEFQGGLSQENVSFSLSFPLDYILSKEPSPQKIKRKRTFENPVYVSLPHVEQWAVSEGFYKVESDLQRRGLFYWKEGRYFSRAQLLIYVNRIRLDRKLQPLAFYEEEDLYAGSQAY